MALLSFPTGLPVMYARTCCMLGRAGNGRLTKVALFPSPLLRFTATTVLAARQTRLFITRRADKRTRESREIAQDGAFWLAIKPQLVY